MSSQNILLHGPDSVEHFHDFSMASVIAELQATCPEVYSLVQQLGSTQRYEKDGVLPDEELKGVMAICTLLNARSARVKGMQLMISLMLVARASCKQVYTCTWKYMCIAHQPKNFKKENKHVHVRKSKLMYIDVHVQYTICLQVCLVHTCTHVYTCMYMAQITSSFRP